MKSLYLLLHLLTISFPLLRSFEPKIRYASTWKSLFPAILVTATFFIIWDVLFTKQGIWGFNSHYYLGVYLFGLPIEEWLFFFTVPFSSVFIYECVKYFLPNIQSTRATRIFTIIAGVSLLILAALNPERAYTFWNFTFCGIFLVIAGLRKKAWLGKFWVAYALHLIPFFLINGVLTGSFIEEEVVWYNDLENLGIRLGTIPIEDTIYALLLFLMNVTFFEMIKKRYFTPKTS